MAQRAFGDNISAEGLSAARRTLAAERSGIDSLSAALTGSLGEAFTHALQLIRAADGRVVVTGMGKSGHVGTKIAATLASTGTPAFFVHPAEASHGDLGMVTPSDVILALSWSGETSELNNIVFYSGRFRVPLIAMTSKPESTLARAANLVLPMPDVEEACPHGLAPTTSALVQLALGDALAIALLEERGFSASDFKVFHPGGTLGGNLKRIGEIMHTGDAVPLVSLGTSMPEAIRVVTEKSFGCVGVVDAHRRLIGVVTDGDIRRHLGADMTTLLVEEVMTPSPRVVSADILLASALERLNRHAITALFVVEDGRPVGIVHMHDFLRTGTA